MMKHFYAFILRDFYQTLSYRFAFLLDIASVFFNAATFYFVAKLFEGATIPQLAQYGGQYFPFVFIGIAFSTFQTAGLNSFSQNLRQEQFMGTLESVLSTPVTTPIYLAGSSLWDFLYAGAEVLLYFIVALSLFGLRFFNANYLMALLSIALTLTTFMGLGILAAAFILRFKRGNPITWMVATASELLGGVYFPTQILPDWMKSISDWIPMTHALTALRQSFLADAHFSDISHNLLYLLVFSILIWPIGIFAFKFALRQSQTDGSLGHY